MRRAIIAIATILAATSSHAHVWRTTCQYATPPENVARGARYEVMVDDTNRLALFVLQGTDPWDRIVPLNFLADDGGWPLRRLRLRNPANGAVFVLRLVDPGFTPPSDAGPPPEEITSWSLAGRSATDPCGFAE